MPRSQRIGRAPDSAVREVLTAVRALGDAMDRMYGGMRSDMDLNATDLAALRMLIIREQRGDAVTPQDIARHLRISTASTTKLLDRLTDVGYVLRRPHPSDGRARLVALTEKCRATFMHHFRENLHAMQAVAVDYSGDDLRVVTEFLERLSAAIDP